MAGQFLARGWLEFWLLRLSGRVVAAEFGFCRDRLYSYLQGGFDPDYSAYRVGLVLRAMVVRELIGRGVCCYDFLGDLILQVKDIAHFGIIALGPEVMARRGVDELGIDSDPLSGPAHAAFEYVSHGKLFRDLPNLYALALVGKGGVAGDDKEARDA